MGWPQWTTIFNVMLGKITVEKDDGVGNVGFYLSANMLFPQQVSMDSNAVFSIGFCDPFC